MRPEIFDLFDKALEISIDERIKQGYFRQVSTVEVSEESDVQVEDQVEDQADVQAEVSLDIDDSVNVTSH